MAIMTGSLAKYDCTCDSIPAFVFTIVGDVVAAVVVATDTLVAAVELVLLALLAVVLAELVVAAACAWVRSGAKPKDAIMMRMMIAVE
jgi:hypothetical protein